MTERGFAGNILFVDLSTGEIRREPLERDLARKFIGGLGVSLALAWRLLRPGCEPLGQDNALILGTGPLVGTDISASSRVYGVGKFPSNGAVGWCGAGGMRFGSHLKCAGLDHVIIQGRSSAPVILRVWDDGAEISDANDLWSKG